MEDIMTHRIEKDSLGEVPVPSDAYYGAQTQRAIDNFPISGIGFNRGFIFALGLIKRSAAQANMQLELLGQTVSVIDVKAHTRAHLAYVLHARCIHQSARPALGSRVATLVRNASCRSRLSTNC